MSTPMRRMRSLCCARTTAGHAAAPPSPAIKFRRRIRDLPRWIWKPIPVRAAWKPLPCPRFPAGALRLMVLIVAFGAEVGWLMADSA
jgi:hypothetical protein